MIAAANASSCDAVHPGYGFLAERGDFAKRMRERGPDVCRAAVKHLDLFGDKARARQAASGGLLCLSSAVSTMRSPLAEAKEFFASLGSGSAMIIKALAGGGGRGTRGWSMAADEIEATLRRCRSEARAAFGCDDVYVEEFLPRARHVEVQILGDRAGAIALLGERECSVQRRFQKLIEIAPAPNLDDGLRRRIIEAAMRLARSVGYSNLGTFEFLVDVSGRVDATVCVHRSQCPAAGGAHGHRGGDWRRPGAGADHALRRADARGTGARKRGRSSRLEGTRSRPGSTWRRSPPMARSGQGPGR